MQENVIKHSPAENPNPVLRADPNGKVLYANKAAFFLLEYWGIKEGEALPQFLRNDIKRTLSQKGPEHLEINAGKVTYSLMLHASPDGGYVDIYGFDISYRVQAEEKFRLQHEELVKLKTIEYSELNEKLKNDIACRKRV